MKNKLLFFTLFWSVLLQSLEAQNGTWTWMNGGASLNPVPNYGTQGIPAPSNQPPGIYAAAEWTDLNGNFWFFGGLSNSLISIKSALWQYNVSTGLWTWMNGLSTNNASGVYGTQSIPSPLNHPGARSFGQFTWTDLNGDLWLFGGYGYDATGTAGYLNDMWRYSIATNEWTWMNGPNSSTTLTGNAGNFGTLQIPASTNNPPSRSECVSSWIDNSGNLWMFGGDHGIDDMWMYNTSTYLWTWMSGQSTGPVGVNYGTLGSASPTNTPGGRIAYSKWKDKQDNLWFFGGADLPNGNYYADMWMYNRVTNFWTWMAGSSIPNQISTFTQQCVAGNGIPGAVYENRACWTDDCGRFWQLGGFDLTGMADLLWMFDPISLQFTWVSGSLTSNQPGNFGTQNIPVPTNSPPSLGGQHTFKSFNGDLWMFGGYNGTSVYNTLWRYQIDPNCPGKAAIANFTSIPDSIGCTPVAFTFTAADTSSLSYHWDFGDLSLLTDTSNFTTTTWTYTQGGTYTVTLIAANPGSCNIADTSSKVFTIYDPPTIDIGADTAICSGQTITLTTMIPGSYLWNTGDTTSSILVNSAGQYSIQITTDTFNCIVDDTVNITLTPLPTPNLSVDTAICNGQTMLLNPGTFDSYQWNTGATTATLTANAEGNYSVQVELNNCFNSDTVFIRVDEEPTIGVGTDSVRCNIVLDAGNPGASYLWNTGETTQTITATQTGTYSITITNGVCVVVDSITINGELGGGLLYIPNAFTPDQNGINEKFQPVGTNIVDFSMAIYNRWGELVYQTNDIMKGWDGRRNGNLVQEDVYVYSINYSSDCLDGKQVKKLGQVTVLR